MIRFLSLLLLAMLLASPASAGDAPAPLQRTTAFEHAYAASFYEFDACGDGIAGRLYRDALVARLKQCPFSTAARQRFQIRAAAQRHVSSEAMAKLIAATGGLPTRLPGMTRTCREQRESPEYRRIRARLEAFWAGKASAAEIVPQPCDAGEISP